jgi:hypothetical protein
MLIAPISSACVPSHTRWLFSRETRHHHAHPLRLRRNFDLHQLFHRQRVHQIVRKVRQIIHAIRQRHHLLPGFARTAFRCRCAGSRCRAAAETMVSPSSSSTMRSTPCVDGCCGPMFSVMRRGAAFGDGFLGAASVCYVSVFANTLSLHCSSLFILIAVLVPVHRIILAQRMAFPIARHQDARRIGMIAETDAEHIEHFALIPVGGAPDTGDRIDLRLRFSEPAFQAEPRIALRASAADTPLRNAGRPDANRPR